MNWHDALAPGFSAMIMILACLFLISLFEFAIPLRNLGRSRWTHLWPNLGLTAITLFTNTFFNVALVMALFWLQAIGFGLLHRLPLVGPWEILLAVVILDFSFYVAHVAMHKVGWFWRFHAVHHSDSAVDVTTTIRQHPVEGVIRYAFLALFALPFGISPAGFALYRAWSALNGLMEHANLKLPMWLDRVLAWITTWPYMHKVHHSRHRGETDANYSNIFSIWDRLFLTFTPTEQGVAIDYGLDGYDTSQLQSLSGLLAAPFENRQWGEIQPAE